MIGQYNSDSGTSNNLLYLIKLTAGHRYTEGNFGGNQLLDGLISLFPPIPKFDNRFSRQNRYELPSEFPLDSTHSVISHHLLGSNMYATTQNFLLKDLGRWMFHLADNAYFNFISHWGLPPFYSHIC